MARSRIFLNKTTAVVLIKNRSRSMNAKAGTGPRFKATQLMPTMGNRLRRIIARKLACFAMMSAMGRKQVQ